MITNLVEETLDKQSIKNFLNKYSFIEVDKRTDFKVIFTNPRNKESIIIFPKNKGYYNKKKKKRGSYKKLAPFLYSVLLVNA